MRIELLYFAGCPAVQATADILRRVLSAEGVAAEVRRIRVPGPEAIAEHRFVGSPTIRIDGIDLEGAEVEGEMGFGWRCRLYRCWEPGQSRCVPAADLIRERVRYHLEPRERHGRER